MIKSTKNVWILLIGIIVILPMLYLLYHESNAGVNRAYFNKEKFLNKLKSNSFINKKVNIYHDRKEKAKAAFVVLMRNIDLQNFQKTMQQLEDRFNKKFNYPYVFLNDEPFTEEVKQHLLAQTKAKVEFGLIPKEHWSIPDFLDEKEVMESMKVQEKMNVPYGGKLSYHHMCRYESGFFAQHELLAKYEYYWRVEPEVEFMCDINEDPFMYMKNNNKKYGFTITMAEFMESIPTLYSTMRKWIKENNIKLPTYNLQGWVIDEKGKYNGNHFWSNFEIGSLDMLRSEQYLSYFNYLDKSGGFFFERWGDAPVHSLYVTLMLNSSDIHFFKDIGYKHDPYGNCPIDLKTNLDLRCYCKAKESSNFGTGTIIDVLDMMGDPVVELLRKD